MSNENEREKKNYRLRKMCGLNGNLYIYISEQQQKLQLAIFEWMNLNAFQ